MTELATVSVTVDGEVERPGSVSVVEGTTLKGLFEIVRPTPAAYIDHADYTHVLREGDEVYVPASLRKARGKIVLTEDSLQRVRIRSIPAAAPLGDPASAAGSSKLVNLNRASLAQLQQLPRIGPETAQRIIADRESRGPFKKKEDLLRVRGIGRKTYTWLEPLITVE